MNNADEIADSVDPDQTSLGFLFGFENRIMVLTKIKPVSLLFTFTVCIKKAIIGGGHI